MRYTLICIAAALALACTVPVYGIGDTFRCGVKWIKVGDTEEELVDACGRPDSRRIAFENIRDATGRIVNARVENYTYEDRDRRTTVLVSVLEGEVVRIYSR
jgi:hypothetical protein